MYYQSEHKLTCRRKEEGKEGKEGKGREMLSLWTSQGHFD
jgi:hypothetical protein